VFVSSGRIFVHRMPIYFLRKGVRELACCFVVAWNWGISMESGLHGEYTFN